MLPSSARNVFAGRARPFVFVVNGEESVYRDPKPRSLPLPRVVGDPLTSGSTAPRRSGQLVEPVVFASILLRRFHKTPRAGPVTTRDTRPSDRCWRGPG